MRAMMLQASGGPLVLCEVPRPAPLPHQVLLRVLACGVCRTDLHLLDGELPGPKPDLIPGHEIVGAVVEVGEDVESLRPGDRVGVPWLASTCGACEDCLAGRENLCPRAEFTGYTVDGGYAEYAVADARFCFVLPAGLSSVTSAPLLCAGLIGYRSYRAIGFHPGRLGLYGFGAAAHLLCQVAVQDGCEVFAYTRPGDRDAQEHARELGAAWAGGSDEVAPRPLDAAVIFAAAGELVPVALAAVRPGGVVVCGGIHMSDIPSFPYSLLWGERVVRSVANLTRADGADFLARVERLPVLVDMVTYSLERANDALEDLRRGRLVGAAVLVP